ncbi:MAG: hypothetical protein QOK38_792 [Acidobacteriaceae bacterium]|nr:hypothetical protein [Acidobacteriaceae bacterium]
MTRKHIHPMLSAGVLSLVALSGSNAFAQSQVYALDLPVTAQTTTNTCTAGEPVILNGTVHLQYSFTTDPAGVNHFSITTANDLSGVGQISGAAYKASDSNVYTVNSSDPTAQLNPDLKSDLTPVAVGTSLSLVQTLQISMDTSGNLAAQINQNATQCAN